MFSRDAVLSDTTITKCPDCYGKGEVRVDCSRCSGCGKETCHECGGKNITPDPAWSTPWLSCARCDGSGREKCGACHGCGYKWGACASCEGAGELSSDAFTVLQARKQHTQQQQEQEYWQQYEEEARRWDAEVGQWFEQDLNRRIERRRLQRQEQRQRRWKTWKRRMATATCLSMMALLSLRYGPSGVLWAKTEAQRYLHPTRAKPVPFVASARRLVERELNQKNAVAIDALRHEILARRGLRMTRPDLQRRFSRYSWYRPNTNSKHVVWERLSPIERYNCWFIADYQIRHRHNPKQR